MGKLDNLNQQVRNCRLCRLCRLRMNGVPGEGSESAEVMFIGEGPGFNEDREGRPFVGAAGHFLDELLGVAGLRRPDVYITNVVKCRPPQNRDPLPDEIDACAPYLERQIATIDPLLIVTLGRFSMARFFPDDKISSVHGKAREMEGRIVMTMWHPAFGLRSPEGKESIKEDFRKLPEVLERAREVRARRPAATARPLPDLSALVAQHFAPPPTPLPVVPTPEVAPPAEPEDAFAYLEAVTSQMRKPAGRRKRSEVAAAEVVTVPVVKTPVSAPVPEATAPAATVIEEPPGPPYASSLLEDAVPESLAAPLAAPVADSAPESLAAPSVAPTVEPAAQPPPARRTRRPKAESENVAPPMDPASGAPDAAAESAAPVPEPPSRPHKKGKAEPDFTQLSLFE